MLKTTPRILLIGQQGQVAWELQRTLATLGELIVVGRDTHPHALDLSRPESIASVVEALQPQWIVNAAAYTAVDKAEQEEALATTINALAVGELAAAARRVGALIVHYSTDYVFDGMSTQPYTEDAPTRPQSAYGRSKLAGEEAIRNAGVPHLILRTSWVYGARGNNFMRTIRRLAREREELRIVADQYGCPTWSRHIAEATAQILAQLGQNPSAWNDKSGTYHLVSSGQGSWYDFAARIVDHQRQHEAIKAERILPIRTEDYPLPAPRPGYSVLCTDKLRASFGIHMPHWESALSQVHNDLNMERN
ncbi:MAG: dTDP-4-dehydrorhamnose reductase [Gammaproteobacteria bacterium 28-57-27]|nr:MAG: dTDP-4-dehydrorhamnose reductase [Gammaproteobacteria bacterium 28-57-27]